MYSLGNKLSKEQFIVTSEMNPCCLPEETILIACCPKMEDLNRVQFPKTIFASQNTLRGTTSFGGRGATRVDHFPQHQPTGVCLFGRVPLTAPRALNWWSGPLCDGFTLVGPGFPRILSLV